MNGTTDWLFARGHAADIVLLVMLAEAIVLLRTGRAPGAIILTIVPGALMILSLRAALSGLTWPWIAVPLALSGPVHLADLRRRRWLR